MPLVVNFSGLLNRLIYYWGLNATESIFKKEKKNKQKKKDKTKKTEKYKKRKEKKEKNFEKCYQKTLKDKPNLTTTKILKQRIQEETNKVL